MTTNAPGLREMYEAAKRGHTSASPGALPARPAPEPVKKPRAPLKTQPVDEPEVRRRCLCYCGERFDDAHKAWVHIRSGCGAAERRIIANMRRRDGTRFVAECGTTGGYARHRRWGEPPCEACRAAVREYYRKRRQDPAFLERERENHRKRRQENPDGREREREYKRNPAYQERARERKKNPAYRERQRAYRRERYARLKAEAAAQPDQP